MHVGQERRIQDLGGKPEGKKLCARPRCRWKDNIKKPLQEAGYGGMDWTTTAQDTDGYGMLVNAVMKFRVPKMRGIS